MLNSDHSIRSTTPRGAIRLAAAFACVLNLGMSLRASAQMISDEALARLDLRSAWSIDLPLEGGEEVTRTVALDDNLYVLTSINRVYAVHLHTGILRWASDVSSAGDQVRGPTHSNEYAVFTTPGAVRMLDRRTGLIPGEPRHLSGVVVEIKHDTAEVNLGEVHGLKGGEILNVYMVNEYGDHEGDPVARIQLGAVKNRYSKGQITSLNSSVKPLAGYKVEADLTMPLEEIKLPFAASSPAVANASHLFVGAANQRFYCVDIHRNVTHWQLMTPNTVTVPPILDGKNLLIAGQDGLVTSCTQAEKARNWTFMTEGPIFANLVIDGDRLFVASSDRSLYCLNRVTGKRLWRERFDSQLNTAPMISDGRVYLPVPDTGLHVLDATNGTQLWKRPQGGRFLLQLDRDAILLSGEGTGALIRVDAAKGTRKQVAELSSVRQVTSSAAAQAILIASADGRVQSLRSRFAPRVRPDDVAEVLYDADKARAIAKVDADRKAAAEKKTVEQPRRPTARELMFDDDWLSSRSTAKPVGGHGLVDISEDAEGRKPAAEADEGAAAETDDDTADKDSDDKEGDKESANKSDEESDSDDADASDDESGDDADESADDSDEGEGEDDESDEDNGGGGGGGGGG
ncbi:MAG: hypothetical protein HBSAPP02_28970 [Phycisphaerae bacterium]|nr:MAG: PQQ-binding-like beta-propeller repeat protein [Planctomycetia bacterium]RIK68426.1 MAG: hypothetical protein DCC66_10210 [Planctomycetota bacterium]GJQ27865.1 MAG: hypothetical protein HBSAPP02_28970 [Phycisphaerae bacterium]